MKILVKSVPANLVIISDPSLWLTAGRQYEKNCHFSRILHLFTFKKYVAWACSSKGVVWLYPQMYIYKHFKFTI